MSFSAKVYKIMIASPGDVNNERNLIRDGILSWNNRFAESRTTILLPVGWETHSVPEMGAHPQTILNKQLLEVSDILVAVFSTRLGSPTLEHPSGTVEEINKFIETNKTVMLYFSNEPVDRQTPNTDQYKRLEVFKEECKNKGLYAEYNSISDLKEKFSKQLDMLMEKVMNERDSTKIVAKTKARSSQIISIGKDSQLLLTELAKSHSGEILQLYEFGGRFTVQVNGKDLVNDKTPREKARWESVIQELLKVNFIIRRSHTILEITKEGYDFADNYLL